MTNKNFNTSNVLVTGVSMSGKTNLISKMIVDAYEENEQIFVLCPYKKEKQIETLVSENANQKGIKDFHSETIYEIAEGIPLNLFRIPTGMTSTQYIYDLASSFCAVYEPPMGLFNLRNTISELYAENGISDAENLNTPETWLYQSEHSKNITIEDLYNKFLEKYSENKEIKEWLNKTKTCLFSSRIFLEGGRSIEDLLTLNNRGLTIIPLSANVLAAHMIGNVFVNYLYDWKRLNKNEEKMLLVLEDSEETVFSPWIRYDYEYDKKYLENRIHRIHNLICEKSKRNSPNLLDNSYNLSMIIVLQSLRNLPYQDISCFDKIYFGRTYMGKYNEEIIYKLLANLEIGNFLAIDNKK